MESVSRDASRGRRARQVVPSVVAPGCRYRRPPESHELIAEQLAGRRGIETNRIADLEHDVQVRT